MTVTVRDQSGARRTAELTLSRIPDRITLRELIRTRVREEVALANAEPGHEFRTLVQPTDSEVSLNGYRLRRPKTIDWHRQAAVAEDAFAANGFFVLVDGRQIEDLEEELELTADSEVRFVKLVPLVGG